MRGKAPKEIDVFGVKFTFTPLPFRDSQPMIPEIGTIISMALKEFGHVIMGGGLKADDDVVKLLPALTPIFQHFQGGLLDRLAPKLLASTTVVMEGPDGQKQRYELMKPADREYVFDEYPECFVPAVFLAGRVTYGRFFPEGVLRELLRKAQEKKAGSTKIDSSPSI